MIPHLALSPHPTSRLSDVICFLIAAFPQVPGTAARWRARRHDVTTLPALNDYHERPRCASTTRRQLAAKPACSRRVGAPSKPWGDGCSRQVGEATTRRVTWAWGGPYGPSWRPFGSTPRHKHAHPPLRLINSVEQTRTRPSHGKVLASLSYESLGVCFLVRRQTPVGHGVFMPCHERVAPARTSPTRVRQVVEHSGDP